MTETNELFERHHLDIETKDRSITMNNFRANLYMKLTHKPTGISVNNDEWCHEERSQHKTYKRLISELKERVNNNG